MGLPTCSVERDLTARADGLVFFDACTLAVPAENPLRTASVGTFDHHQESVRHKHCVKGANIAGGGLRLAVLTHALGQTQESDAADPRRRSSEQVEGLSQQAWDARGPSLTPQPEVARQRSPLHRQASQASVRLAQEPRSALTVWIVAGHICVSAVIDRSPCHGHIVRTQVIHFASLTPFGRSVSWNCDDDNYNFLTASLCLMHERVRTMPASDLEGPADKVTASPPDLSPRSSSPLWCPSSVTASHCAIPCDGPLGCLAHIMR